MNFIAGGGVRVARRGKGDGGDAAGSASASDTESERGSGEAAELEAEGEATVVEVAAMAATFVAATPSATAATEGEATVVEVAAMAATFVAATPSATAATVAPRPGGLLGGLHGTILSDEEMAEHDELEVQTIPEHDGDAGCTDDVSREVSLVVPNVG
jgi:hypothetical protein